MSYRHGSPPGGHHAAPQHVPPPQAAHSASGGHESSNLSSVLSSVKGITVKIYSKADESFNLGVNKSNAVVVVKANDSDPYQQWIKDESWSNKAKDSAGYAGFALINRGTGKALKHPSVVEEKVHLGDYHANSLDEEILWTVGKDEGKGWHAIRSISNIGLNLDIDHGGKKYGPIKDGQAVIVFTWKDEDNQYWKLANISAASTTHH